MATSSRTRTALIAIALIAIAAVVYLARPARSVAGGGSAAVARSSGLLPAAIAVDGSEPEPGAPIIAPASDEPPGALRLEGQVISDDDTPVAGAEVVIDTRPPRRVVTADDGSFAVTELLPRRYALIARAGDRSAGPVAVQLDVATEPAILRLRPASSLEVTVVDDRGAAIADAAVELRGLDATVRATSSAGVARFDGVLGGSHVIAVDAAGFAPVRVPRFLLGQGGAVEEQSIALRRGVEVRGTVTDDAGAAVAGARIIAVDAGVLQVRVEAARDGVRSDAAGAWTLPALAAGSYRLAVVHAEHALEISPPIVVADRSLDGIALRVSRGCRLRGVVRTGAGEPAVGIRITAGPRGAAPGASRDAVSDDAGRFELRGLRAGRTDVVAHGSRAGAAPLTVELEPSRVTEVELSLTEAETIRGSVVTADGKQPVAEATIVARPAERLAGESARGEVTAISDYDGGFELAGLRSGMRYLLYAARAGESPSNAVQGGRPLATAVAGSAGIRLELSTSHAVRGRLVVAGGSPPALFTVTLGSGAAVPFGGDGSFTLRGVSPGSNRLAFDGPELMRHAIVIEVPADRDLDLGTIEVPAGRRISGRVTTAAGAAVAGARISAGEHLLGDASRSTLANAGSLLGTREATSERDGSFVVHGLPDRPLVVVADHPDHGRSPMAAVAAGSREPLALVLAPTARLDGIVIDGGRGRPEVPVVATRVDNPRAMTSAVTDSRGEFSLLALAPGEYKVAAMLSEGGDAHATVQRRVRVEVGKPVRVELTAIDGVTLRVDARRDGQPVAEGQLVLSSQGPVGDGSDVVAIIGAERPIRIDRVQPGSYRACVIPLLGAGRVADADDLRRMRCGPLTVAAAPAEQTVVLDPTAPATP